MYPMLQKWVHAERLGNSKENYRLVNELSKDNFVFPARLVYFAGRLDGKTDPYTIGGFSRSQCDSMLESLDYCDLLRKSRILERSFLSLIFAFWFPKITPVLKRIARIYNALLIVTWLPVFIWGITKFALSLTDMNGRGIVIGIILAIISGGLQHEFSHACAAITYGASFYEMGINIGLIPGAYVLLNILDMDEKRWQRIQIHAAGAEGNLLQAGIFFLLAAAFPEINFFFYMCAVTNTLLGVCNLSLLKGFDGMSIMNDLLGERNFISKAVGILTDFKRIRKLTASSSGIAALVCGIMIILIQITLPAFIALNFIELYFLLK